MEATEGGCSLEWRQQCKRMPRDESTACKGKPRTGLDGLEMRENSEIFLTLRVGGRPLRLQELLGQLLWHMWISSDMNPGHKARGRNNPKFGCFSIFIRKCSTQQLYTWP